MQFKNANREEVERYFKGLQVIEGRTDLRIQIRKSDINRAVKGDATKCVFSRACQRVYNSQAVLFFGTVAYVDLLDDKGVRHIERFIISKPGMKFIRDFDNNKTCKLAGFVLKAPTASTTLDARREQSIRSKTRRRALIKGEISGGEVEKGVLRPKRKSSVNRLDGLRLGTGMVHFTPVKAK